MKLFVVRHFLDLIESNEKDDIGQALHETPRHPHFILKKVTRMDPKEELDDQSIDGRTG